MARIRTIKPEFQNSESMGRVSRDARLTFVLLWPQCDDSGRLRGNSRMLASILFPYDEDAKVLIEGWLVELEKEGCITRYEHNGDKYIAIVNWQHQKVDKPSASRLPAPPEVKPRKSKASSREKSPNAREPSAKPREASPLYQGREGTKESIKEGIKEEDQTRSADADASKPSPSNEIVRFEDEPNPVEQAFEDYNSTAHDLGWTKAQKLDARRTAALKARLSECGGPDGWRAAMAKARASPFLRGETKRTNGHENWSPSIDFFLKQANFTKLMEGSYDQRTNHQEPTGFSAVVAGARAAALS